MIAFDRHLLTSIKYIVAVLFLLCCFLYVFVDSYKIVVYLTLFFENLLK